MSMISSQIDGLRQLADGHATYRDARAVMLQAADTIWQLRDDLQRANAENAELRMRITSLNAALEGMHLIREQDMAENAELRELVCHMHECMSNVDADGNHECFSCEYEGAECDYDRRMRELGVEL